VPLDAGKPAVPPDVIGKLAAEEISEVLPGEAGKELSGKCAKLLGSRKALQRLLCAGRHVFEQAGVDRRPERRECLAGGHLRHFTEIGSPALAAQVLIHPARERPHHSQKTRCGTDIKPQLVQTTGEIVASRRQRNLCQQPNAVDDQRELRKHRYASKYLWGIDFEQRAAKTSRALMLIAGDGHTNIFGPDVSSLDPRTWYETGSGQALMQGLRQAKLTAERIPDHEPLTDEDKAWHYFDQLRFDVILANPPFAGEMKDRKMLTHYELAKPALKRAGDDKQPREERDVLFIERILNMLSFKTVQNKMHWAITGKTAAEIVHQRADANKPNMGLMSWRGAKVRKQDVAIAKNYLDEAELAALNNLVEQYLGFAEGQAMRRIPMHMRDWINKLDAFLNINDRQILTHAGKIPTIWRDNWRSSRSTTGSTVSVSATRIRPATRSTR